MTLTIWGAVSQLGGIVEVRAASGRLASAYAIDDLDARLANNALRLDHVAEERVGRVVYVEVDERDQVGAVCIVADDELASLDGPVFYSGEYLPRDSRPATGSFISERASMVGLSLTMRSANTTAQAIRWRSGSVLDVSDVASWPVSWRADAPLLARARDHIERHRSEMRSRSLPIVDRRWRKDMPPLPIGARVASRPTRGLRHSGHRGRVLGVT